MTRPGLARLADAPSQREITRPEGLHAILVTNYGEIDIELDAHHAPLTVRNFVERAARGDYEGTIFHQVVDGYMLLGGGFDAELRELPAGDSIDSEADNGLSNRRGTVAMARPVGQIDGAARQFFINVGDNPLLDHRGLEPEDYGYCVFGRVVAGLEVVDRIAAAPVRDTAEFEMLPVESVKILSVRIQPPPAIDAPAAGREAIARTPGAPGPRVPREARHRRRSRTS